MGMWQKQLGEMMEHPNQSQPNPGKQADRTPCTCGTIFLGGNTFISTTPAPTVTTNRNNYPTMECSNLGEFSVKLVKHRSLKN